MADYTLTPDDLLRIRVALSDEADYLNRRAVAAKQQGQPGVAEYATAEAQHYGELRDRFYGTEAVDITYPPEEV